MSWHTSYACGKVAVTIDERTHWVDAESAKSLAESIQRQSERALREKARRAFEAAQAKVKQENARRQ